MSDATRPSTRGTTFERLIPWSGVTAAIGWLLANLGPQGQQPGDPAWIDALRDAPVLQLVGQEGHALVAVSLILFAVAIRARLRSGEGGESSYSGVAYGGFLLGAAAELSALVLSTSLAAAADRGAVAVVEVLGYLQYNSWWLLLLPASLAILVTGVGGLRTARLPRWFAIASIVLGALGVLGGFNVPPGGLVLYFLLPVWLVVAAVLLLRRENQARRG